jgi:peroxiredoxin
VPLRPGDPLPDLPLLDATGAPVSLSAFRGEHVLLVFLRHLA